LSIRGPLEKELNDGGQQLELDLGVLILERVQEALQELVGIVNAFSILANNPNHGSSVEKKLIMNNMARNSEMRGKVNNFNPAHLASGSSRVSRFSQRVAMIDSYLFGYFLKMSLMTTIASYK